MRRSLLCYCDGACEPVNPGGVASYGAIIFDRDTWEELWSDARVVCSGQGATNNVAEYSALIAVLTELGHNYRDAETVINTDSKLVVMQTLGLWAINAPHLRVFVDLARKIIDENFVRRPILNWVPRTLNTVADALSKRAYIERIGARPPERKRA